MQTAIARNATRLQSHLFRNANLHELVVIGYNNPMPRPLQFSLRALLVATAIIAGPCAWIAYNAPIVRQRKAMERRFVHSSNSSVHFVGRLGGQRRKQSLPWLRRTFGDRPIEALSYMPDRDPDGLELRRVHSLFPEARILEMPK